MLPIDPAPVLGPDDPDLLTVRGADGCFLRINDKKEMCLAVGRQRLRVVLPAVVLPFEAIIRLDEDTLAIRIGGNAFPARRSCMDDFLERGDDAFAGRRVLDVPRLSYFAEKKSTRARAPRRESDRDTHVHPIGSRLYMVFVQSQCTCPALRG